MRTIALSLFALTAISLMPSAASAEWYCHAKSPQGWGEGWSPRQRAARRIALSECAAHTPHGSVCVIANCHP